MSGYWGAGEFVERVLEAGRGAGEGDASVEEEGDGSEDATEGSGEERGTEEEEMMGRSRREAVVKGRKVLCQVAVRKFGYTGASVARFLGMTTSSVNRMARLEEMPEVDAWDK